jgi:hypothetical protein
MKNNFGDIVSRVNLSKKNGRKIEVKRKYPQLSHKIAEYIVLDDKMNGKNSAKRKLSLYLFAIS